MSYTLGYVSCDLCGATFVGATGCAVPPHACLHSLPQPSVTRPAPSYIPPTLTLRDLFAALASETDIAHIKGQLICTREDARFLHADRMLEARETKA